MAAQAWLDKTTGKKWVLKCTTEVNSTEKTDTAALTTRTDVEWSLETVAEAEVDGPEQSRRVAVMEYKRKHLINPTELLAARYYQGIDVNEFKEDAKTPKNETSPTYFQGTALGLVKQLKGYQTGRNVKDVCLFDYDTMFILNFDPMEKPKNPELWPAGLLFQERANSSAGAAAEAKSTFRSLLLAFLIRALKRYLKETLEPIKYDQSRMLNPSTLPRC